MPSVKDFGATGNGVTDDSPAFEAAIAVLATHGGELDVPPGVYYMSRSLQPQSRVNIRGAGVDATIIKNAGTAASPRNIGLIVYGELSGNHLTAITYPISEPAERANIISFNVPADAAHFAPGDTVMVSGGLNGTNFWFPSWTTTVKSVASGSIVLDECLPGGGPNWSLIQRVISQPSDITISNLTILGTSNAAVQVFLSKNIVLDNICVRSGNGGVNGASFSAAGCRNVTLQNSRFTGVYVDFLGTVGGRIVNNTLEGGNLLLDGGSQDIFICGNAIVSPSSNGSPSAGLTIATTSRKNRVVGNSITHVPAGFPGVALIGEGDNLVFCNVISGDGVQSARGIDANASRGNIIAGNSFNNLATGVAAANGAPGQVVSANAFADVASHYAFDPSSGFAAQTGAGGWVIFPNGDPSPSVANGCHFQAYNSQATSIVNFVGGSDRQEITVYFGDNHSTLTAGGPLKLKDNVSFTPPAQTILKFINIVGQWFETSRVSYT